MVEQKAFNLLVIGSNPIRPTNSLRKSILPIVLKYWANLVKPECRKLVFLAAVALLTKAG